MMKKLGLILLFALLTIQIGQAQEAISLPEGTEFSFIANGTYQIAPFELQWMPDGNSFLFHFIANEGPVLPVFQYFVQSNQLQNAGNLPTEITLTIEQTTAFSASSPFASVSPNKRYAIYTMDDPPCGEAPGCFPLLGIADLKTGIHTPIPKGSDNGYTVRWSADGSAFLIIDFGDHLGGIYYGTVSQNNGDPAGLSLRLLNNYELGHPAFVDISPDGKRVLVREMWDGLYTGLILWDTRSPASHAQFRAPADGQIILPDEVITGASFIPGDERHLLLVLDRGIVNYDLISGEIDLIDPSINAHWVDWSYFSPDTQYIMTYHAGNQIAVYRVEY